MHLHRHVYSSLHFRGSLLDRYQSSGHRAEDRLCIGIVVRFCPTFSHSSCSDNVLCIEDPSRSHIRQAKVF